MTIPRLIFVSFVVSCCCYENVVRGEQSSDIESASMNWGGLRKPLMDPWSVEQDPDTKPYLSDEDVTYIRHVLRLANPQESIIETLIANRHHLPKIDRLIENLSKLKPLFMKTLSDTWNSKTSEESISGKEFYNRQKRDLRPSQIATDDNNDYENCIRDYAAYIEPITNPLYNELVRPGLCEGLDPVECNDTYPLLDIPPRQEWGKKFLDAHGKIPEGIGEGKLHWVGGHDMCLDQLVVYTDSNGTSHQFEGFYCRLSLTPNVLLQENSTFVVSLLYGICAPDTCSKEMVFSYIYNENPFLRYMLDEILNMTITKVYCGQELDTSTDTRFQVAVGVIITLAILNIIGTVYDGFFRIWIIRNKVSRKLDDSMSSTSTILDTKIRLKHRIDLVLVAFSIYTNIFKIFNSRKKPGDIRVLNGIRYLSFVWVIMGNTYLFGPIYQESFINSNIITFITHFPRNFLFQFVLNYPFNIDSFLVVSGVLVTWWWLRNFEAREQRMTLRLAIRLSVRHIVRKYWRLAPALMFTLMFYSCLYRYFVDGPLYPSDIADAENCKVNWWVDMLMIHNLVRKDHICLSWMFYVPMIFQLHVAALVVLIPLVIWPVIGYVILGLLFIMNIIVTSIIFEDLRSERDIGRLFSDFLMAPWCRCGVYIIGMACGIILHKTRCRININPILNVLGWVLAIGSMAAIVFSTYDEFRDGGTYWSPAAHTAYDVLSHPVWGLSVGWIILSCATKHGGVAGTFLEWNTFRALGRLVYTALLTSSLMIFRYVYSNRSLLYVDPLHHTYIFLGHLIYLVAMGLIFALLWHYTVSIGLEKVVTCSSIGQWLRAGRYPPEMDKILNVVDEKKMD